MREVEARNFSYFHVLPYKMKFQPCENRHLYYHRALHAESCARRVRFVRDFSISLVRG